VNEPARPASLADILQERARRDGDALAFRELRNDLSERDRVTYADLDARARTLGARISGRLAPGERALILAPGAIDYLTAVFACLYAGVVPVSGTPPYAPSARGGRHAARLARLVGVLEVADARAVLGPGDLLGKVFSALPASAASVLPIALDPVDPGEEATGWRPHASDPDDIALLQFTSGSTRAPGAVVVRQHNLSSNLAAMARALGTSSADVGVSWLPMFHDLGLIGAGLLSVHEGFPTILMPSAGFLEQPRRWLQCLSDAGGTISWAPNFAYKLCLRSIPPRERAGLDLRAWRVAMNAAEPVQAQTLRDFEDAFAPAGLRAGVLYPSYGLAEATLAVSMPRPGEAPKIVALSTKALSQGRLADPATGEDLTEIVGCGQPVDGVRVAVVDPLSLERAPPDRVGELWLAGPGCSEGYYAAGTGRGEGLGARLETDPEVWLRTGDLGFLRDGHVFITGRLKDLIILRGANLYPQDIEATVTAAHPALRDDCACAVAIRTPDGDEALAIICEIDRRQEHQARDAAAAVRRAVAFSHGVESQAIVLIRTASLPKTPSGKVQRAATRLAWETGHLPVVFEVRLETPGEAIVGRRDRAAIAAWVTARLARAVPDVVVSPDAILADLGLSSAQITELAADIETAFGRRIAAAELFEFRRASDIVDQLAATPRSQPVSDV
jgi:acyl-CoA synthetase (AMP-forming)/AMP-acid ligase II/acyl carrier protein